MAGNVKSIQIGVLSYFYGIIEKLRLLQDFNSHFKAFMR